MTENSGRAEWPVIIKGDRPTQQEINQVALQCNTCFKFFDPKQLMGEPPGEYTCNSCFAKILGTGDAK